MKTEQNEVKRGGIFVLVVTSRNAFLFGFMNLKEKNCNQVPSGLHKSQKWHMRLATDVSPSLQTFDFRA